MSTSSPPSSSSSSMICHQRALSLPQNSNINVTTCKLESSSSSSAKSNNNNTKPFAIQPVHHRTRSLPLTEETAIDFSQSPPNFTKFSPLPTTTSTNINSNNSMESIVEDYQNMDVDVANNNRSILKQLSKIANANNATSSSSQLQMRKKRQHHNVMTASLRSMYLDTHRDTHKKTVASILTNFYQSHFFFLSSKKERTNLC